MIFTRALCTQTRPGPPPRPQWMSWLNHTLGNSCTVNFGAYHVCWSLGRCQHPVCMREHPGHERDEASSWEAEEDKDVHCKELGWESKQDKREHSLQVLRVLSFCTVLFPCRLTTSGQHQGQANVPSFFASVNPLRVTLLHTQVVTPASLCDLRQTWLIKSLITWHQSLSPSVSSHS